MFRKISWTQKLGISALIAGLLLLASTKNQSDDKLSLSRSVNAANKSTDKSFESGTNRLDLIKERGYLICGVNGELPGFSFVNSDGNYAGIDVDFCRAIAAAIFDDPRKVNFRNLTAQERFSVLKSGEIDLLSRNTTQTLSRDTEDNLRFTPPIFYDAQGIMIDRASKIKSPSDLKNKTICVAENTTSYDNLLDYLEQTNINANIKASNDPDDLFRFYEYGQCQGITGDISQLVARRTILANPKDHIVLSETISQEPLAPMLLDRDSQWSDVVKWIAFALVQAEELNINSENFNVYQRSKELEIRKFLGLEGNLGSEMGLSDDFTIRIIKYVGNYGEIYERNLGKPFDLKRGKNALWEDGGLMYSPPFN